MAQTEKQLPLYLSAPPYIHCQWEVHGRSHIRQAGGQSHTHWPHTGCWGREGASPLISDRLWEAQHGEQVREAWIPRCAPEEPEGYWERLQQDSECEDCPSRTDELCWATRCLPGDALAQTLHRRCLTWRAPCPTQAQPDPNLRQDHPLWSLCTPRLSRLGS